MNKEQNLDSHHAEIKEKLRAITGDYSIELDDASAIEASPFRPALEALKAFGFDEVILSRPYVGTGANVSEDIHEWVIDAYRRLSGIEPMMASHLAGPLTISAGVNEDRKRCLAVSFGSGDYQELDHTSDLNELIWNSLEAIHEVLEGLPNS